MELNAGQAKALTASELWWLNPKPNLLISGSGGTGKSTLSESFLNKIKADPIILAPTNEALNQIREKLGDEYEYKTVDSALGIIPSTNSKEMSFTHKAIPNFWENINLAVIDEIGSVGEDRLKLLASIGVPIFGMGDSKQLPPVKKKRARDDLCISPAFTKGWKELALTQPMRNTGELWEFTNLVRANIDDSKIVLPRDFNITNKGFREALSCPDALEGFKEGHTKIIAWTNATVSRLNQKVRHNLFGERAKKEVFIVGDKLIFTKPATCIPNMYKYDGKQIQILSGLKDVDSIFSNAKGTILAVREVSIKLVSGLAIPCYELDLLSEGKEITCYSTVNKEDKVKIADYYERLAWAGKTPSKRGKLFSERHKILGCFAEVSHFYCATAHRVQGSSIDNVIVMSREILQNPCKIEALKCNYVGVSRVAKNLKIYNGVV